MISLWLQVSNLLVTVNSSVNLFVYCVFGERFRNELKMLICSLAQRLKKNKRPDTLADCSYNRLAVMAQTQTRHLLPARRDVPRTLAATENLQDRRDNKTGKLLSFLALFLVLFSIFYLTYSRPSQNTKDKIQQKVSEKIQQKVSGSVQKGVSE